MFKKSSEAKAQQRLSGADRKKLKRTIKERFSHASDADIDTILPPKAEITVAKYPNRAHAYAIEGGPPVLFDVDGRGTDIFPTVYALWKVPDLLPSFMLKGGEVSRFIIGGADLMFPGISIPQEGFPSFLAGQPWAVKVPGNAAPIAVGTTTMSSTEALKAGLRGKALRIMHYYHDLLWESAENHYVPNAGFLEDVVLEDPVLQQMCQTSASCEYFLNPSNDSVNVDLEEGQSVDLQEVHSEGNEIASVHFDAKNKVSSNITEDMSSLNVMESVVAPAEAPNDEKEQVTLSVEEIDSLLDKCLLQALHTTVKDKDFPMSGSSLWSSHVLPCRPEGITLDIKKSSHKKLSKWLQSKSSSGLISVKEDKHKKEFMLLSVNRVHPDFTSFRPEKKRAERMDENSESISGSSQQIKGQLEVVETYKPTTHVNPIFTALGADTGKYYSASEATEFVFSYVERENLVKPTDKAYVVLNVTLCDALYKGTVKKGTTYPTMIHKKDLGGTFVNRMQIHHKVTRGNESVVRKGALKTVQIMTERRQGNKKVTRVSGLESFLIDAEALASELQKKFACSTTVAELPGKKGQHEVLVQGGVIEDLAKHLVEQCGIPKRWSQSSSAIRYEIGLLKAEGMPHAGLKVSKSISHL
ncbi:eukaryotic translation initiation factor 2D isoform X1 [Amborella trichopoda]|uniref:eukaryotic translation initiation factor 2D isoform X1 n=1 Tax=Amborella trichopoda TaxID=13333 RepID=UPI0009BC9E96|nr:eukaryotic translation initiation factor 2D isoform X1 [Amborella trichopoda]|eukprot:XP_020519093.1 eukaryotic translation initiation factor 2D isoform X1 [Amborella trichopoda]